MITKLKALASLVVLGLCKIRLGKNPEPSRISIGEKRRLQIWLTFIEGSYRQLDVLYVCDWSHEELRLHLLDGGCHPSLLLPLWLRLRLHFDVRNGLWFRAEGLMS